MGLPSRATDARPDRLDARDRLYIPRPRAVPREFPERGLREAILKHYGPLVYTQGALKACVGYGLASCITYQSAFDDIIANKKPWEDVAAEIASTAKDRRVSPLMLYNLAQLYDEWDGEDYSGSSCRGAMRGWHKHGVCWERNWRSDTSPSNWEAWRREALSNTLGAYFRIQTREITDIQAAIHEVHAVFASARCHDGWMNPTNSKAERQDVLPEIPFTANQDDDGGHAFAIVGYDDEGFIILNSWGSAWGNSGFARLSYEDWLQNGMDAWCAARGAPRKGKAMAPAARTRHALLGNPEVLDEQSDPFARWSETTSYSHTVILGNAGAPLSRLVALRNGADHLKYVAETEPRKWLEQAEPKDRNILIFALGGLLSERDTLERVSVLGPYFLANKIYPIFMSWNSGMLHTIETRFQMAERAGEIATSYPTSMLPYQEQQVRNYTVEVYASGPAMRPIWTQYKASAKEAATGSGGARKLVSHIKELYDCYPELRIHVAAQSVASLLAGHILEDMGHSKNRPMKVQSLSLFAPACSMDFADRQFGTAVRKGLVEADNIHIERLSDENERRDTILEQYGHSLLYLISNALETQHATTLLGLERDWQFSSSPPKKKTSGKSWCDGVKSKTVTDPTVVTWRGGPDSSDSTSVPATHRSFLYSCETIENLINRICGKTLLREPFDLR